MTWPGATDLLLGLDAGTTLLKAALYTPEGELLGQGEAPQGVQSPQPGWAEQDPRTWWRGMLRAVRQALSRAGVSGDRVTAIGLSTQGGTLAVFHPDGRPKGPALVWSDSRQRAPDEDSGALRDEHFRITGLAHRGMTPAALGWLKTRRPEWFQDPYRIGYVPDYLTFRLTGRWVSHHTNLAISGLCDLAAGDIGLPLLERLGVPRAAFAATAPLAAAPPGQAAGPLLPAAARALRLRPAIPVAVPVHDQYAAALGAGCTEPGDLLLSTGTAWALLLTADRLIADRTASFWPSRHLQEGRWGLIGAISSGSMTLDRLVDFTLRRRDWERINAAAESVPPGSDGLLVIPHLVGRTLPTSDLTARGAILGWSLGHGRRHLWRAAMEGLAFETRAACEYLAQAGARVEAMRMVGGAARSPLWPRIVASVLGVPLNACAGENLAARGAACLAARALGAPALPQASGWARHDPVPEWRGPYEEAYRRYLEAIARLERA